MKNIHASLLAAAVVSTLSLPAHSAMLLGATAELDYWVYDSTIDGIKAHDVTDATSVSLSVEHFIPLIHNGEFRYTGVKASSKDSATNLLNVSTDYEQYDLIAYYEILDNDMLSFDIGLNLQHYTGKFTGISYSKWQPNLYSKAQVGLPTLPLSVYGEFSYGTFDDTSTVDFETGVKYTLDLIAADINFDLGYRIQDNEFSGILPIRKSTIKNEGFYLGVEIAI